MRGSIRSLLSLSVRPVTVRPVLQTPVFLFQQKQGFSVSPRNGNDVAGGAARAYLILNGLTPDQVEGVMNAFPSPPTRKELEDFGPAGLKALLQAVDRQLAKTASAPAAAVVQEESPTAGPAIPPTAMTREKVSIFLRPPRATNYFEVEAYPGETLYDVSLRVPTVGEILPCTCGGIAACSTCHVYVEDPSQFAALPPPDESEEDLIDLAADPRDGQSRLGCQVTITKDMGGFKFALPNKFFDLY